MCVKVNYWIVKWWKKGSDEGEEKTTRTEAFNIASEKFSLGYRVKLDEIKEG